jgi:hypothetical protein
MNEWQLSIGIHLNERHTAGSRVPRVEHLCHNAWSSRSGDTVYIDELVKIMA